MAGFFGLFYNSIDSKGRIVIPSIFREELAVNYNAKLVVVNDALESCLLAYPEEDWKEHIRFISTLPQHNKNIRFYMRRVIASASVCEIDKHGRILIPVTLRKTAALKKDVVIAGQGAKLEIWDKNKWEEVTSPDKVDREEFIRELNNFNI
ncbi:MAG: division/cell wall cluster transcriptional repressor MraZ [Nitrospirae bacterium]|nr:MAG: division/cell wall cluster transcriptional repressor MraZ [Nitrospirota bacterium]